MRISDWSSDVCASDLGRLADSRERADRGSGNRADRHAMTMKRPEHADMRPAQRGAAAQRKRDRHCPALVKRLAKARSGADLCSSGPGCRRVPVVANEPVRSEEKTSELQSIKRTAYAVLC